MGENPVPLVQLNSYNDREYILELWHGPTCAFKDVALQLLPHLMTASIAKPELTGRYVYLLLQVTRARLRLKDSGSSRHRDNCFLSDGRRVGGTEASDDYDHRF